VAYNYDKGLKSTAQKYQTKAHFDTCRYQCLFAIMLYLSDRLRMHITSTCSVTLNGWLGTGRRVLEIPAAFFFYDTTAPSGPGPAHCRGFTITLRHTTFGKTPLDEWPARRRDLYMTTPNTHKRRTYMPPAVIRTLNPNKRAVACPHLGQRGHWNRQFPQFVTPESPFWLTVFRLSIKSVRISNTVCSRLQLQNLDAFPGINRLEL
jgi:hypothetical protein